MIFFRCGVSVGDIKQMPNGLRYLRWGGDGEAVQPEKCLKVPQNPTRQVHAMLARSYLINKLIIKFIMTDEITPRKKPKKQSRFFSLFTTFSFVV